MYPLSDPLACLCGQDWRLLGWRLYVGWRLKGWFLLQIISEGETYHQRLKEWFLRQIISEGETYHQSSFKCLPFMQGGVGPESPTLALQCFLLFVERTRLECGLTWCLSGSVIGMFEARTFCPFSSYGGSSLETYSLCNSVVHWERIERKNI